ncbi:MAG: DoxX family protein [Parachlamydiales bacterium]|jgi:putative oxidoreductase
MSNSCRRSGSVYYLLTGLGKIIQPFLLLALRLYFGFLLLQTGLGKLGNISQTAETFQSLNIPLPHFNAYLVGIVETIGSLMLIFGFGARFAALAIAIVMSVAYATAHHDAIIDIINKPELFAQQAPFNYLLTALIVLAFGPGLFSIDAIIKGIRCRGDRDDVNQITPPPPPPK